MAAVYVVLGVYLWAAVTVACFVRATEPERPVGWGDLALLSLTWFVVPGMCVALWLEERHEPRR